MTATWPLVRFILRRDRVRLTVWVLVITVTVLGSVSSFATTYPTAADRQERIDVLQSNGAAALFVGPGYGAGDYTFGAMTANEMLPITAIVVALMSITLVVRHTRAEEEQGRADLVRSAVVGRFAPATAALVELVLANAALCVLLTVGLPASLEGLSTSGSFAFAAALAGVGLVFAALALVAAQLTVSARAAIGLASVTMAALYLLRSLDGLAWLSPFGWASEMRAYVDERWWPLALLAALTAALVAVAFWILARRDVGAGVIGDRPARPRASARLRSSLALAVRLQRASLIAWGTGLLALAAVYGSIATDASGLSEDVDALQDYYERVGQGAAVDQYVSLTLFFCAALATAFAIQAALRPRHEETEQRAEPVLATAVSRARWLGGHLAVSFVGGAAILVVIGFGTGAAYALSVGDAGEIPRVVGAALVYAPAMWVFTGIATLLFGVVPRAATWTWAAFGVVLFLGMLGPLLQPPDWVYDISPFEQVPHLPAEDLSLLPLVALTAIAVALTAAGVAGLRRRDLG